MALKIKIFQIIKLSKNIILIHIIIFLLKDIRKRFPKLDRELIYQKKILQNSLKIFLKPKVYKVNDIVYYRGFENTIVKFEIEKIEDDWCYSKTESIMSKHSLELNEKLC